MATTCKHFACSPTYCYQGTSPASTEISCGAPSSSSFDSQDLRKCPYDNTLSSRTTDHSRFPTLTPRSQFLSQVRPWTTRYLFPTPWTKTTVSNIVVMVVTMNDFASILFVVAPTVAYVRVGLCWTVFLYEKKKRKILSSKTLNLSLSISMTRSLLHLLCNSPRSTAAVDMRVSTFSLFSRSGSPDTILGASSDANQNSTYKRVSRAPSQLKMQCEQVRHKNAHRVH